MKSINSNTTYPNTFGTGMFSAFKLDQSVAKYSECAP